MSEDYHHDHKAKPSRGWITFGVFIAAIAILLAYEHRAHLLNGNALLFVLLGGCIAVHLFMHGGHGGGGHGGHGGGKGDEK